MPYHPHIKSKKDKYPLITLAVSIIAIVSPIMTLPQVYQIFSTKQAAGVSIASWTAYIITSLVWLSYGFMHKEKPIIINSVIGGILSFCVVVGALMYGSN